MIPTNPITICPSCYAVIMSCNPKAMFYSLCCFDPSALCADPHRDRPHCPDPQPDLDPQPALADPHPQPDPQPDRDPHPAVPVPPVESYTECVTRVAAASAGQYQKAFTVDLYDVMRLPCHFWSVSTSSNFCPSHTDSQL